MDWLNTMNPYQAAGVFLSGWVACTMLIWSFWRLISRGKLRTEREVDELRRSFDSAEAKADTWRQAWQERERTVNTLLAQQSALLKLSEVSTHVLESLPQPGGKP